MNPESSNDEMTGQPPWDAPFPAPSTPATTTLPWNVPLGFFNWAGSVVFTVTVPLVLLMVYAGVWAPEIFQQIARKQLILTKPIMLVQLAGTFLAQVFSLLLCWVIVTGLGKRSFFRTLELQWSAYFRWPHAIGLGLGMFLLSMAVAAVLPQHETDLDKFLKFGFLVRVCLAVVATVGAPLQEEIVYRGVLYPALERSVGLRNAVIVVSLLFCAVHVPQYWQSPATLVAVLLLSFVLTILRAWTGKLLPCVATHLIFNGIQGVLIILTPEKATTPEPVAQPALFWWQLFGG